MLTLPHTTLRAAAVLLLAASLVRGQDNLALGRPYAFSVPPNDPRCTDPGDATDLTDGKRITDRETPLWNSKGAVGWSRPRHLVSITLDLGDVKPIGGAAFCTAAGADGVTWPAAIHVFTSDDGQRFQPAGELIRLMDGDLPPACGPYDAVRFAATSLRSRGRYVRFDIRSAGPLVFVDEIEVHAGDESLLQLEDIPAGAAAPDETLALAQRASYLRIRRDLEAVRRHIHAGGYNEHFADPALHELSRIRRSLENMSFPESMEGFRPVVPLNDLHRSIFRVQATLLRARGAESLTVWLSPPQAPLSLWDHPGRSCDRIDISLASVEDCDTAINFTNASPRDVAVSLAIAGLPIVIRQADFFDSPAGCVIHSAVRPLDPGDVSTIHAGMTRQLRLTVESAALKPGRHEGALTYAVAGGEPVRLPVAIVIIPSSQTHGASK